MAQSGTALPWKLVKGKSRTQVRSGSFLWDIPVQIRALALSTHHCSNFPFRLFYKTKYFSLCVEETIIIGGGIAGLACARKLSEENMNFKLISQDIGGRITTSSNGEINYAAYVVPSYYKHFKN